MKTVNITPLAYKLNSPQPNTLGVKLISDNLKDTASLYWEVASSVAASGSTHASYTVVDKGNVTVGGTDYSSWSGDNNFPFTFVAQKLGLTLA